MKIIYKGIEMEVDGDYQPEEAQVWYDSNMEGYPGCPASFSIYSIFVGGVDIIDIVSDKDIEKIEETTLNEILA